MPAKETLGLLAGVLLWGLGLWWWEAGRRKRPRLRWVLPLRLAVVELTAIILAGVGAAQTATLVALVLLQESKPATAQHHPEAEKAASLATAPAPVPAAMPLAPPEPTLVTDGLAKASAEDPVITVATFWAVAVGRVVFILVALGLLRALRVPWRQVGLRSHHVEQAVGLGLGGFFFWTPIALGVNLLIHQLVTQVTPNPAQAFFNQSHSPLDWLAFVLAVVVLAPMAEELLFRGLVQGWLSTKLGAWPALLVAASLFGWAHAAAWPDPLALTVLGLGFGLAYQRTGCLAAPIAMHAAHNGLNVLMALLAPAFPPAG